MTTETRIALVLLFAVAAPAFSDERRDETTRRPADLRSDVQRAFAEKDYGKALAACEAMTNAFPKQPEAFYNLGCALARLQRGGEAIGAISNALDLGFADPEWLKTDDDLASIRAGGAFEALVTRARRNELNAPFEKGAVMKGVRTVEAFPEGGLRYRLRMSETATTNKPDRLIVWLHPSGGSMNGTVEAMAPGFIAKGFALLVPTRKSWAAWFEADGRRLLRGTLPDVARIGGIDARRPILMGFSAGGQLALFLWREDPLAFGGLVIDEAYPVDLGDAARSDRLALMALPEDKDFSGTPLFVIVGDDGRKSTARKLWEQAKSEWPSRVPLTLHVMRGRGHEWLFGREQTDLLHAWLSEIAGPKGDRPGR